MLLASCDVSFDCSDPGEYVLIFNTFLDELTDKDLLLFLEIAHVGFFLLLLFEEFLDELLFARNLVLKLLDAVLNVFVLVFVLFHFIVFLVSFFFVLFGSVVALFL
jgi:hypothetical protein